MNSNIFNYHIVRTFLRRLLTEEKFKNVTPPDYLKNKCYIDNKYAFYLGIDAIIKYDQIIEDEAFINNYINDLKKIFIRYRNYNYIQNGIYSTICKNVAMKLEINNIHTVSSREKILRYVYNKYIVNGYFYFGFSSNYLNEIKLMGIDTNTFFLDDNLAYINDIFQKKSGKKLFLNNKTTITDDAVVATYFAFLSPYYLADMVENPLFRNNKINRECFYRHDLINIKNSISKVCFNEGIDLYTSKDIVNSFSSYYISNSKKEIKPCLAKINRRCLKKDKLSDIDYIIKDTDLKLATALGLILESRYSSCNIQKHILPSDIEIMEIPTYQEFLTIPLNLITTNKLIENAEKIKANEYIVTNNIKANSYGIISLAYIGLLFILIGIVLTLFISFGGA